MSRYSDEVRAQALAMLQTEGYDATIRSLGIAKDTLYRWKREAGLTLPGRRARKDSIEPLPTMEEDACVADAGVPSVSEEETSEVEKTVDAPISDTTADDGMVTDMMLLTAANEQLRMRNAQLRKALVALLER